MSVIITKLCKPLTAAEVEVRIGTTAQSGFSLLAYKTARTDVNRLNDACGTLWKNRHFYDDEKLLCCEILIFDNDEWIGRSDVGKESFAEKEYVRPFATAIAKDLAFNLFDFYKKAHGMPSYTWLKIGLSLK